MSKTENDNTTDFSGTSLSVTSLDSLIAQIDQETGPSEFTGAEEGKEEEAPQAASDQKRETEYMEQYIRFYLDDVLLAIPLSNALEIGHRPAITYLPNLPEWILGVSNIRGEIVSIIDLKLFFGLPAQKLARDRRFITVRNKEIRVGFIVDRIVGIYSPDRTQTQIQASPYEEGELSSFISGVMIIDDQLVNILDVDKLLSSQKMNAFRGE